MAVTSRDLPLAPAPQGRAWQGVDVGGGGERVDHRRPNDLFHAHLSIYRFAEPYARDARVLDAGCGTGYGAAWLARHGASAVIGVDIDRTAVAFARDHFAGPRLGFRRLDLERLDGLDEGPFDLVFSSNTLEHLGDVDAFLRAAHRLLAPGGALVVAVPAVFNAVSRVQQLSNPHHLVIWSPEQWRHALARYFAEVEAWRHLFARHDVALDVHNAPEESRIDATDFAFERLPDDDLRRETLSSLFVARRPRDAAALPPPGTPLDYIDDSFVRPRPRLTPLSLEEARVPPRPLAALPLRAWALLRVDGPRALAAEARRYLVWRLRRRLALRLLGDRADERIATPRTARVARGVAQPPERLR